MIDPFVQLDALAKQLKEIERERDNALQLYVRSLSEKQKLEKKCQKLEELCNTDQLTEIGNRRHLITEWRRTFSLMERDSSRKNTILLLDVDHFKEINTRFGYGTGDTALVLLAKALTSLIRPSDIIARLGGDEFVVILEETPKEKAVHRWLDINQVFSERLWESIYDKHRDILSGIGTSCGIVEFRHSDITSWTERGEKREQEELPMPDSLGALLAEAEECLQQSKLNGKNRATWKDEGNWLCKAFP